MTDLEPSADVARRLEELLAGVAALAAEVRGVTPLLVPATGLIPDVVDGALIESAWGNGIRSRTEQWFDSLAQLQAQWPAAPTGAVAMLLDSFTVYVKRGPLGTDWRPMFDKGRFAGSTDATGAVQVPHKLGAIVTGALGTAVTGFSILNFTGSTSAALNFSCRGATGTPVASGAVNFSWMAWL